MIKVLAARDLTLHEVKQKFNLQFVEDPAFFPEWQVPEPSLSIHERWLLDKAKADFFYLDEYPLHEEIVKLVVLSPILSVAGFYGRPFCPVAERQVEIEVEESEEWIRGRIDLLVLNEQIWVTVIEAKSKRFGVREALPQTLLYLLSETERRLAPPSSEGSPSYGLAMNGSEFLFVKSVRGEQLQYGFSRLFSLFNPGNELGQVVGLLRALTQRE
ncbi:MAG: restriction endonuclease subunit R [Synechococcales cyanobacterium RU_4_20]|nr:restriction endonuclease subunit R [Synechococcales cyanobacterium RU_4_20]NJR69415.1 restriction endonuclease subunit R [Synechococcales cyanobacterium CRU_2_2]